MFVRLFARLLVLTASVLSSVAQAQEIRTPEWLKNRVDLYRESHPDINFQVTEYNGNVAYYIPSRCCDIPSELYDESGYLICYPDGGFAGGDGKCPSFRNIKQR